MFYHHGIYRGYQDLCCGLVLSQGGINGVMTRGDYLVGVLVRHPISP